MINGFALNHHKSLQIYFFCVKRRAKKDFLKDVRSTVVTGHRELVLYRFSYFLPFQFSAWTFVVSHAVFPLCFRSPGLPK